MRYVYTLLFAVACSGESFQTLDVTLRPSEDSSIEDTSTPVFDASTDTPAKVPEASLLDNHVSDSVDTSVDDSASDSGTVDANDGNALDAVLGCESLPCYSVACDSCCTPKVDICNVTCACL